MEMNMLAALQESLKPILSVLKDIDPSDPNAADLLNQRLPLGGPELLRVRSLVDTGLENGWLCPREGAGLRYGRASRASEATHHFSIETVDMAGSGPGHLHPDGEFDLCFPIAGSPLFDGHPPGWTVYPPGSWHVPTVTGGRMGILYFLPNGAIRFGARPAQENQ
jgi:hypothetical protein